MAHHHLEPKQYPAESLVDLINFKLFICSSSPETSPLKLADELYTIKHCIHKSCA